MIAAKGIVANSKILHDGKTTIPEDAETTATMQKLIDALRQARELVEKGTVASADAVKGHRTRHPPSKSATVATIERTGTFVSNHKFGV